MGKLKRWLTANWRTVLLVTAILTVVATLFLFQLGKLTDGLSQAETAYIQGTSSVGQIINSPVFFPHKLLTFVTQHIGQSQAILRLPSALLAMASVLVVLLFMRSYYSIRTVLLSGALLAMASWLLTIGRVALPDISLLLWAPMLATWLWLKKQQRPTPALLGLVLLVGLSVYLPGYLWLLIAFLILDRQAVGSLAMAVPHWLKAVSGVLLLVMLMPLVITTFGDASQLLLVLGLPQQLSAVGNLPSNLIAGLADIFIVNQSGGQFTLGRLPYLDIFSIVLFLCGVYAQRYSERFWQMVLAAGSTLSLLLIGIGGLVSTVVLLPIVYGLIVAGVAFLLTQWFTVFPNNPIARSVGTTLMTLGILTIAFYHVNRYFIAWPQAPETRQQFNYNLVK